MTFKPQRSCANVYSPCLVVVCKERSLSADAATTKEIPIEIPT